MTDDQRPKRIVYIEDDQEMIELVTLILSRRGYEVIGAQGGRNGLEVALAQVPDLILLDLMMPDVDGWEVFQQLKNREETRKIPVIVITAKAQPIDRVLGLHIAKVDDYIAKPFHPQELVESIENVLKSVSGQPSA
ncbi:chemotaxis protein CheY [Thermanaerothrix daxensis]|uniref:Chemotaxis protein CheY n=1 Tax=Thermanaerothrix daxensis TaxID=869279 RepID=A0A0P6Y276_9CHLR|nr:response regulator [Thermanaerothrix daxensis]KPL83133.1 chemotaxis protein CheY [Thermanaerothrix daxensis]